MHVNLSFGTGESCGFNLSNLCAQESVGYWHSAVYAACVCDNEIRCIACNVGIDDEAVPRTQSNQVKYLIQHYEVLLVALIARVGFAVGASTLCESTYTCDLHLHPLHARTSSF
jgi:hypothetical protein